MRTKNTNYVPIGRSSWNITSCITNIWYIWTKANLLYSPISPQSRKPNSISLSSSSCHIVPAICRIYSSKADKGESLKYLFQIGKGKVVGENELLILHEIGVDIIRAVTIDTDKGEKARWVLPLDSGRRDSKTECQAYIRMPPLSLTHTWDRPYITIFHTQLFFVLMSRWFIYGYICRVVAQKDAL